MGHLYQRIWRNKFLTVEAGSLEAMIRSLRDAADELQRMCEAGVLLRGGTEDDYAVLTTTDEEVAVRLGFEEVEAESEEADVGNERWEDTILG